MENNENNERTVYEWNIFERMAAITADLERVNKSAEVGYGKNKYKAVLESDILDAIKPLEEKYRVYSYPINRETMVCDVMEQESSGVDDSGNPYKNSKAQFIYRVRTTYRFVNIDNPAEYIDMTSFGDGIDNADKAPGKAMTYSDKYALMKAYKITTGDDPDKDASPNYSSARLQGRMQDSNHSAPPQTAVQPHSEPKTPPATNGATARQQPSSAAGTALYATDWTENTPIPESDGLTLLQIRDTKGVTAVRTLCRNTKDPALKAFIIDYMTRTN